MTDNTFHVIVKDNKSGEVLKEADYAALIFSGHFADGTGDAVCLSRCNAIEYAKTVCGAVAVIQQIKDENPIVAMIAEMFSTVSIRDSLLKGKEKKNDDG